ncbi:hypothetical protein [Pelosinus sp. UFO1]|uniref:hypothetical protein n=1 Tax=Pelosinus sp. UFO1 TaxID=484770 RepID=UPI0004D16AFE|nr:hypothetical protein [Pelosinus sp. UFO1]AIF52033.1 hypothetical protein UFO1_2486 [Pelosinus sp. UFO1]
MAKDCEITIRCTVKGPDNMRTLSEIIESAKDGKMPSYEECYWAMLCYESMFNTDHRALREALLNEKPPQEFIRKLKADNSFNMYKNALNKPPKEFLGPNNDPSNPGYQEFRKIGKKLIEKFINKDGENS